ncbi:hypothetical protein Shyhy01_58590 [Streptomyces hygroscopicus subsp. hygroscopicus]|nr:hypothetical protein Shyhy01_58590 [Streptomyces hygroscopicus subsp. hygroscopicus]
MVHGRRQQMVRHRPVRGLAVEFPVEGTVPGEVLDQHREPPGGEAVAVPVEQVDAVVAEQIRFEGLGVFVDEPDEAQSSPRPSPVSLP